MTSLLIAALALTAFPADAVTAALADAQAMPATDVQFQRYIWLPTGSIEDFAAVSVSVNQAASQAATIIQPVMLAGGSLQRWDLRALAPDPAELTRLIATWERMLGREKYFHALVNGRVAVPPYKAADGKTYDYKIGQIIATAPHTGAVAVELSALTQSSVPIVRYDFFQRMLLTTIDGGLYYEFQQIDRNPKGKTAQAAWLETVGASEAQVAALGSDERAAIFRSGVTGKPRRIDAFYGAGVRPSVGVPIVTITHDIQDGDVGGDRSPILSLLDFKDRAREAIAVGRNGMLRYALFDAAGVLQDEVPPNVAADHNIPAPHTKRLQAGMSCLVCHALKDSSGREEDGLKTFGNDVRTLQAAAFESYGDITQTGIITPEVIDRLRGLYSGDLMPAIFAARTTYAQAVFSASGGRQVPEVTERIWKTYREYALDLVTPEVAARELGQTGKAFGEIVPLLDIEIAGHRPDHPFVAALRAGIGINRDDWESVYSDTLTRSLAAKEQ